MITNFLEWFQTTFAMRGHAWIVEIFIIIFITFLLAAIAKIAYKKIFPRLQKTKNVWDEMLVKAFHKPFEYFIWLLGLTIAAEVVGISGKQTVIFNAVTPLRELGIIGLLAWALIRLVNEAEKHFSQGHHKKIDRTTANALGKITKASIIITAVLVGLQSVGIGISGVLAFGGIGGAAIAFAAKDLLANFFGGLIIYLDRPFAVGDWVRSPDRNIEGTVEEIGWRLCRIRTFDKRPLYVPNSLFSTISIENPSRMLNRRINTNIGVRYKDATKMSDILQDIDKMLREHQEIDTNQTLMVNLINFGHSSLEFMIYCFTKTTDWVKFQAVQQDVFLKIIDIITAHGAECAFPSTTLYVPEGIAVNNEAFNQERNNNA